MGNPDGARPISVTSLIQRHRDWIGRMPALTLADGTEFDKAKIVPYCYRHTYAQRHADAGVAPDVLRDLMNHHNINATLRYYRIGEDRRRDAVDRVTAMHFDRHGNRIWRDVRGLLDAEHARYAIGEVAVPYGRCAEPSNVAAGGGACPIRFRCAGCDHFRTDVSYLPDLTAYLDDLLRTRERLAAAIDGVDDWARADATPAQEEITRIRRLISRIKGDLAELGDTEQAAIDDAVTALRKHRAVTLGMPAVRPRTPAAPPAKDRVTTTSTTPSSGHRADAGRTASRLSPPPPARHRRRSTAPPPAARRSACPASPAPPGSTAPSSTATATCSPKSTPSRPRPARRDSGPARPSPGPRCKPTCSQHTNAPPGSAARIRQLEQPPVQHLGEQAWRESGLGAPADIDALNQQDHQPRAAGHRPPPPTRRTRPGPRRRPRRQPRAHGPAQRHHTPPMTRRMSSLHHTCRTR